MRRLNTLPLWAVAGVLFVLFSAVLLAFDIVFDVSTAREVPFAERVIGVPFVAAFMTVAFILSIHRARVRAGGADALHRMQGPLRRGEVPADADATSWSATLDARYQSLRRSVWSAPLVFGSMILLSGWMAVTQGPGWWIGVAAGAVFLVVSVVSTRRELRKTVAMREELKRRT